SHESLETTGGIRDADGTHRHQRDDLRQYATSVKETSDRDARAATIERATRTTTEDVLQARGRARWRGDGHVRSASRARVPLVARPSCEEPLMIRRHARYIAAMRVVCVARHPFLSEHLGRLFEPLGVETIPCVGLREALASVATTGADAVICDYDLLAAL